MVNSTCGYNKSVILSTIGRLDRHVVIFVCVVGLSVIVTVVSHSHSLYLSPPVPFSRCKGGRASLGIPVGQ